MTDANPHATKHPFGPSYQLRELPGGQVIPGAAYAPDPRPVFRAMQLALSGGWRGDFPEGIDAADLACNGGYHGIKLLRGGANRVHFIDMHTQSVDVARETALAWGYGPERATFLTGSIESFDPGPSFDLVMAHQVIYHLADPIGFLRRTYNALRPEGVFAMYTRVAHAVHPRTHEWVPSWLALQEVLQHVGYKAITVVEDPEVVKRVKPDTRDIRSTGQEKVLVVAFTA
jgi:2-polyprenyl-3-methyl-5-hydroxy-6-metoxy-1,4-benzoquinol methylase